MGRWSHHDIGLANRGGKMMGSLWLGIEGSRAAEYRLYLDNVIVRRADGTVIEFYRDGDAPEQRQPAPRGYSDVSVNAVPLADIKLQ